MTQSIILRWRWIEVRSKKYTYMIYLGVSENNLFNVPLSVFKQVTKAISFTVYQKIPFPNCKSNGTLGAKEHWNSQARVADVVHVVRGRVYVRQNPLYFSLFHQCFVHFVKIRIVCNQVKYKWIKGVVSKETMVLRRWGSCTQEFGFVNGIDNVNWPPHRDSKSWRLER